MKKWNLPIRRMTRTNLFWFLLAGSIGFAMLDWYLFKRLNLMLSLGFTSKALSVQNPLWLAGVRLAYDLALGVLMVGRLHDIGKSGWWLAIFLAIAICGLVLPNMLATTAVLFGSIALLFWSAEVGPNQFGADPRGWKSREQFDQQQKMLSEQKR